MPTLTNVCTICKTDESKSWWKCCPIHTTEKGVDVVCENCANRCMSGKEMTQIVSNEKSTEFMSFFYKCENEDCKWFNKIREVYVDEIVSDWFVKPNLICRCGWIPRPVSENEQ